MRGGAEKGKGRIGRRPDALGPHAIAVLAVKIKPLRASLAFGRHVDETQSPKGPERSAGAAWPLDGVLATRPA
jgi:hypothetical protein